MQKRQKFLPAFSVFFILASFLFLFSNAGFLGGLRGFVEGGAVPLQKISFGLLGTDETELGKLQKENAELSARLAGQVELTRENSALRDQFLTDTPSSRDLIPAVVIGVTESGMIIDRGSASGIEERAAVIFKNNLVGQISKVSERVSTVSVITGSSTTFTAKTLGTQAQGVIKGEGGALTLSNVVLTEKIEKDDLVVTSGDVDGEGIGFLPDLVVGKITSVNRKESDLFQTAEVKSLLDFGSLEMVFVISDKR